VLLRKEEVKIQWEEPIPPFTFIYVRKIMKMELGNLRMGKLRKIIFE